MRGARWYNGASPDGTELLYYQDGHYYAHNIATGSSTNITSKLATSFIDTEDDHNVVASLAVIFVELPVAMLCA